MFPQILFIDGIFSHRKTFSSVRTQVKGFTCVWPLPASSQSCGENLKEFSCKQGLESFKNIRSAGLAEVLNASLASGRLANVKHGWIYKCRRCSSIPSIQTCVPKPDEKPPLEILMGDPKNTPKFVV